MSESESESESLAQPSSDLQVILMDDSDIYLIRPYSIPLS